MKTDITTLTILELDVRIVGKNLRCSAGSIRAIATRCNGSANEFSCYNFAVVDSEIRAIYVPLL